MMRVRFLSPAYCLSVSNSVVHLEEDLQLLSLDSHLFLLRNLRLKGWDSRHDSVTFGCQGTFPNTRQFEVFLQVPNCRIRR